MQLILRQALDNLGATGDLVDVKPGYARNYLIPKGFAYEATPANVRRIETERAQAARQQAGQLDAAREQAKALEGVSLTFRARAGQEGKLFGSITASDIAAQLAEQGIQIDRRAIELDEPIKALGVTSVPVRIHAQVRPEIKVWVIQED